MTERWQERRVESKLLKRELLLRLRAEHYGVPGRGEPATDHFRRRIRRLLLRHPFFALKLYLLLIDFGLGRVDGRKRSYLRGSETRARANAVSPTVLRMPARRAEGAARVTRPDAVAARAIRPAELLPRVQGRGRRPSRDSAFSYRRNESVFVGLGANLRRQRLLWHARLVSGLRTCKAAGAAGLVAFRRQELSWFRRLGRGFRACGSFAAALAIGLRRAGGLLFAGLVRALRTFDSVVADLVAEGRRYLMGLAAAGRRGLVLVCARSVHLCRACGSRLARLLAQLRREQLVLGGHLVGGLRTFGTGVDGLVAEARRPRPGMRVGLARAGRRCESAVTVLVAACRRGRRSWDERLFRAERACRSAVAGLVGSGRVVTPRRRRGLRRGGLFRSRPALTAKRARAPQFPRPVRGVLAGVALAALAASAVVAIRDVGPSGNSSAAGAGAPRSTDQIWHGFLDFPSTGTSRTAVAHNSPARKHVENARAKTVSRAKPRVTQRMTLVSNTVPAASVPTAPAASTPTPVPHSTGPSPLRAPPGSSGPAPLKAP